MLKLLLRLPTLAPHLARSASSLPALRLHGRRIVRPDGSSYMPVSEWVALQDERILQLESRLAALASAVLDLQHASLDHLPLMEELGVRLLAKALKLPKDISVTEAIKRSKSYLGTDNAWADGAPGGLPDAADASKLLKNVRPKKRNALVHQEADPFLFLGQHFACTGMLTDVMISERARPMSS